jgi:5-formyltetrahydrofolate cyclo-ligase
VAGETRAQDIGSILSDISASLMKKRLREQIWKYLEDHDLARFPRPVYNRIPNFAGAEEAASRIRKLAEFSKAEVVKVNPDSPQMHVRRVVLEDGKTLLMPTPRLSGGFLRLESKRIEGGIRKAFSISGAFKFGRKVALSEIPNIDLIVAGSVAVSLKGGRIGKGEGYSEMEYGILRERKLVDDDVKVVTTIHDSQVVGSFPLEKHDIPVDHILTPTRSYETHTVIPKPKGIYWELVTEEMLHKMPILEEVRKSQLK